MGWKEIDERPIRRGEILLDLEFLEVYEEELNQMNLGRNQAGASSSWEPHYRIYACFICQR